LSGEDDRSFRNGVNISRKTEGFQIHQKILSKKSDGTQIVDILLVKMEVFHVVDHLLQTGGDGKTVSVGIGAEERVEDHGLVGIFSMKIALHHGKLIQIRQQGEVSLAHNNRSPCCFCIVLNSAG